MHTYTRRAVCAAGTLGLMGLAGCASGSGDANATADTATEAATSALKPVTPVKTRAQLKLEAMTSEQKVAQLFFVTPEQLTGVETVTAAGDVTHAALEAMPVGGICYFGQNITGDQQLRDLLAHTTTFSSQVGANVPAFLSVDEEGGPLVARVAKSGFFDVPIFPNMFDIGATGDTSQAANVGSTIGGYLKDIGFNVDFAPDADVLTNPDNPVIGKRSFGSDAEAVSQMVAACVGGFESTGVVCCAKHFPGHGNTQGDSHEGAVSTDRTADELTACEYLPFKAAIDAGVPMIMIGHILTPNATTDGLPSSLSSQMITDVLRGQLGFTGVVVSDSFSMGAITQNYDAATAAVDFLLAGGDMVLMPEDLDAAHKGVLDAVAAGQITQARVDESVGRILAAKEAAGILA